MAGTVPHVACEQKSAVTAVTSVTLEIVMRLIVVWVLAGCSFDHGVLATGGAGSGSPDAAAVTQDAATTVVDATVVTPPMDAPPCADDDGDGVCNTVDDWPCGAKPSAPGATVSFTNNNGQTQTTITATNVDGTGRLAIGAPQEQLSLTFDYAIEDTACAGACIDQIEVGWVPGGRAGCVFDDQVPAQSGADGSINVMIRAPTTRAIYDLRVNLGQNYSCNYNGANSWWNGTPAATKTIAKLCVH